jgi:hypothetical protein
MNKRQFIEYLESLPIKDDALLNISVNQADILLVEKVEFSESLYGKEFCLDFTV